MIGLTKKSGYAIIALSYLRQNQDKIVSAKKIAEVFDMPPRLTMNILKQLNKAGIVESIRGTNGGYRLKADPRKITLRTIIKTMEGEINLASCMTIKKNGKICQIIDKCPIRAPIHNIQKRLDRFLGNISLEEITEEMPVYTKET